MSEGNLLAFGCAVSFIAAAGAYVFVRERFTLRERRAASDRDDHEVVDDRVRNLA